MPATAEQITLARSWIGNTETDAVFNERFDRLGSPGDSDITKLNLAIEESMRAQLAALTFDQPGQITVSGDSFNWASNFKSMEELLDDFLASGGIPDPDAASRVLRLTRADYR